MPSRPPRVASLLLHLDARRPQPLHRQIFDALRGQILRGVLVPGSLLPSSRELAKELGVARTTVLQGLDALIAEGYLVARTGSGVRVSPQLPVAREFPPGRTRSHPLPRAPRLSALGRGWLRAPAGAPRLGGAPRAFRPGVPALDLFPTALWGRLAARCHARAGTALLDGGEAAGLPDLRRTVAEHVAASRGVRCTPEQVFVTAGTQPAYEEILRTVLDPGDAAWVEDPSYFGARRAVHSVGGKVVPVPVDADGLVVSAGLARGPDARVALVAPSHQYPTGVTLALPRRLELLQWAARTRSWLVEDDYDSEFRHRGHPLLALQGIDETGCVLYVGTFSKTLFPGLRLGFTIVPPALVPVFEAARRATGSPAAAMEQAVVASFLAEGHFASHLRKMRVAYRERSEALLQALHRDCPGTLTPISTEAGIQLTADLDPAIPDRAVRAAAAERGVELGALSDYYLGPARRNGLVFGFGGVRPEEMRSATRHLAQAIEAARRGSGQTAP